MILISIPFAEFFVESQGQVRRGGGPINKTPLRVRALMNERTLVTALHTRAHICGRLN